MRQFFAFLFLVSVLDGRVWTTIQGAKSEGDLMEVMNDRISLRMNGREYHFDLARFIEKDREYVREWKKVPRCDVCKEHLREKPMRAGESIFHKSCFHCLVCKKNFRGGESIQRDQWGGLAHLNHGNQLVKCDSCSKFFSRKQAQPRQLFNDGRSSCVTCYKDGIFENKLLDAVHERVKPVMRELGMTEPIGSLRLSLVDRHYLNSEALKINAKGNLRGLTLTKYKITRTGTRTQTSFDHKIFVLHGLPHIECVAVLAHELAHVWLNERFIEASPPEIEGFCNLVSDFALDKEKSKLSTIIKENMHQSQSPIYGAGYRKMKNQLATLGWPSLLSSLKKKSSPPRL